MILTLFLGLIILSLILIAMGYYIDNPVLEIAGFTFLFLLGFVMNGGLIQIQSGEYDDTYYKYGNNLTGYHWDYVGTEPAFNPANLNDPATVFLFHEYHNKTIIYTNFDDTAGTYVLGISLNHFFGWLISLIGVLGFVISLTNIKGKGISNDD